MVTVSLCNFDSETRSTRRKKVKIKDEEEVVEEEQQSSEDEAPVPDLINDTDDPGFEPELENGDDDDNEIDELIRDMKQEQVSYFSEVYGADHKFRLTDKLQNI